MTGETLAYFFPWSFVVALLIALFFAAGGLVIYKRAITKPGTEPSQPKSSPQLEKWQSYFSRFGFFPTSPLHKSFSEAVKLMQTFIGGTQFRYQLPWFVMLGASDSGKSTLLRSLDLDRPIGRPHFQEDGEERPLCDWWFYEHGIVLDANGKMVLEASQPTSDESKWRLFLNLLAHFRPKRPLDGVILTIPVSELVGQTAFSHDDIAIRAESLYQKLWEMQRITGIRVPIYIVITKCDLIPGFESLCNSLPARNKSDIFGWSNDKAIDLTYSSEWIDEAFSSLRTSLSRTQEEIYTDAKTTEGRDGVFLFPLAFAQLKSEIKTYVDHLFKPSSYHEAFFLRGIYFIGDNYLENPPSPIASSSLEIPWKFTPQEEQEKRNLYFINDLFENKVFREVGLARPVSRVLLGNTTAIRFAKAAIVIATIIGTLGLLRANEDLQKARANLMSALPQIDVTLGKIKGQSEETEVGRIYFDEQAQIVLNTLTQINVNSLFSVFIPPSWVSQLDEKIREVMILVYDKVILRSMANQLRFKAQQLVSLNTPIAITETVGNGIDPLKTAEFYRLKNYVFNIQALELAAKKFNELGITSNLKDVADIIKYLFNYDMPESFFENDYYYIKALKNTSVRLFDFSEYQGDASIKLHKLFDAFELAAFDPEQMIPGLETLNSALYEFSGARNYTAYDANKLREIYSALQQTIATLMDPGLEWLDLDSFDPGPQYTYVLKLIIGSNFFSKTMGVDLTNEINKNFIDFRKRLAQYQSSFFEERHLFALRNNLAVAQPSQGALLLEKNLGIFFNEPFMAPSLNKSILTDIPIGSVLLWDTLRLQDAVQLVKAYNNFMNSRLLSMPKALQPLLQKVGRESLTANLTDLIANAEVFSTNTTAASAFSPEDALLSQVQNYRASAPYLEQLLSALKANNANTAFSTLKDLLTSETYLPLQKLDSILTMEAPYAIKMNSFEWWNGQNMAALEAFGVTNLTELRNYLELQRERIHYLAREFAEPLVSFLQNINGEGMPENLPLVTKWEGIINEFNGYERKAPGNGLAELENFIMGPLNEVTLATCAKYANVVSMISVTHDFFISILVDIQEKLHKQCVALSGFVSVENYSQVAQFFNTNLGGKLPFVKEGDCQTAPDANPEDIRTFFEMLDTQASSIRATLKEARNLGPAGQNALTFIEQMEQVRKFFGGYLDPQSAIPTPGFNMNVDFRVNREKEAFANEILDWRTDIQDSTISIRSSSRKASWKAGDPMSITFQWAANSPLQPYSDESYPHLDVVEENATFAYTGTWPLLRFLLCHHANPSDFNTLNDEEPITLRFVVPLTNVASDSHTTCTESSKKAVVFVRLSVSPFMKKPPSKSPPPSGAANGSSASAPSNESQVQMGQPVKLPYFPSQAPQLNKPGVR